MGIAALQFAMKNFIIFMELMRWGAARMLTVDKIREAVGPLCEKYKIPKAYLFGSYARGDATSQSDVDIRIEREGSSLVGLFAVNHLRNELEDAFQRPVDLLTSEPQGKYNRIFRDMMKKDEVLIYEA